MDLKTKGLGGRLGYLHSVFIFCSDIIIKPTTFKKSMQVLLLLIRPLLRPGTHLVLNLPNFVDFSINNLPDPLQSIELRIAPELVLTLAVLDERLPLIHNQNLRIFIGIEAVPLRDNIGIILAASKFLAEVVVIDIHVILLLVSEIHEVDGADGH